MLFGHYPVLGLLRYHQGLFKFPANVSRGKLLYVADKSQIVCYMPHDDQEQ